MKKKSGQSRPANPRGLEREGASSKPRGPRDHASGPGRPSSEPRGSEHVSRNLRSGRAAAPIGSRRPSEPRSDSRHAEPSNSGPDEQIWVTGVRPVEEVLRHSAGRVQSVILAETRQISDEFRTLVEKSGIRISRREARWFNDQFPNLHHQAVAAQVQPRLPIQIAELLRLAEANPHRPIVVLDCVQDPHNLGAVIRAAEASGALAVVSTTDRSAPLSLYARRASAGASEILPVCFVSNLQRTLEQLKAQNRWVMGTSLEERATDFYQTDLPAGVVVVLGSEGDGMRPLTAKMCDFLVTIPLLGSVQSINVSQAGSIVLFELLRRARLSKAPHT